MEPSVVRVAAETPTSPDHNSALKHTEQGAARRTSLIAVVGLGYVGLPTALALRRAGRAVLGIDICERRLAEIRKRLCDLTTADQERLSDALADDERFQI